MGIGALKQRVTRIVVTTAAVVALVAGTQIAAPPLAHAGPKYDRTAAQKWALDNVDTPPSFEGEDCTWYVSQALWAGGLPQTGDWTGKTWDFGKLASRSHYPGPTKSAVNANMMVRYLVDSKLATMKELTWTQNNVPQAQIGDIIAYDWDPPKPDGSIDHIMIITGFSGQYPLVSGHTNPRRNQGWTWDSGNNKWIQASHTYNGNGPRVYLVHIK